MHTIIFYSVILSMLIIPFSTLSRFLRMHILGVKHFILLLCPWHFQGTQIYHMAFSCKGDWSV